MMNLPQNYFPVPACPHVGEGKHHRLLFAEYGSYQNVNVSIDEEKQNVSFWPQKGQGRLENLARSGPSIPMFDHPVNDEWIEWDYILGVANYNEVLSDLRHVVKMLSLHKGLIKNRPEGTSAKKFKNCKEIIQHHTENAQGSEGKTQLIEELKQSLQGGLHTLATKYNKITSPWNRNCLNGYNRDFWGGLLSVVKGQINSAELLIHAGGASFKDIYMTEVSQDDVSTLKCPRVVSKLALDDPVFQISTSPKDEDKVAVCARQKTRCTFISTDTSGNRLELKDGMEVLDEVMTSCSFSPYLSNELLASTDNGSVYLWDINSSYKKILEKPPRFECSDKWSCAYFGGHPRQVVVADNTSVEMFDHRSHFSDGVELFSLSHSLIKPEERVMAAATLGFPYHAVITDYAVFIMDQRFGSSPVLQWSPEFVTSPQYIQVLQQFSNQTEQEKLLFLASQQPAEVMCFPVNILKGRPPSSPILPWKLSQMGEFFQSAHTSYACNLDKAERRFQASLAGLAVSELSSTSGFTIYQMDAYGDIFYETMKLQRSHSREVIKIRESTEEERKAIDERAGKWLQAFDTSVTNRFLKAAESQSWCSSVSLDSNLLGGIFSYSGVEEQPKRPSRAPASPISKRSSLHRKLRSLEKLPSAGSNTQLHLALRANKDIKELLIKREADHTTKKKKMREAILHRQGKKTQKREKAYKSASLIDSDSDTDSSDPDCDSGDPDSDSGDSDDFDHGDGDERGQGTHKKTLRSARLGPSSPSVSKSLTVHESGVPSSQGDARELECKAISRDQKSTPNKTGKNMGLPASDCIQSDDSNSSAASLTSRLSVLEGASGPASSCKDNIQNKNVPENPMPPPPAQTWDDVASTSYTIQSDQTCQSERQLSSFTRSKASDSSTSKALTAIPFSINQNMVRRSFRDSESRLLKTDEIHSEAQSGLDTVQDRSSLAESDRSSSASPADKSLLATSHKVMTSGEPSQQSAVLTGQKRSRHGMLHQLDQLSESNYSTSSLSGTDSNLDTSCKQRTMQTSTKKRKLKHKPGDMAEFKATPGKKRKIEIHANAGHGILKSLQPRVKKKITSRKQILHKQPSEEIVRKQPARTAKKPLSPNARLALFDTSDEDVYESDEGSSYSSRLNSDMSTSSVASYGSENTPPAPASLEQAGGTTSLSSHSPPLAGVHRKSQQLSGECSHQSPTTPTSKMEVPQNNMSSKQCTDQPASLSSTSVSLHGRDMSVPLSSLSSPFETKCKIRASDKSNTTQPKPSALQSSDIHSRSPSTSPTLSSREPQVPSTSNIPDPVMDLTCSPSLFSNPAEVVESSERHEGDPHLTGASAAPPISPHHSVLSWLLHSLSHSSRHKSHSLSSSPNVPQEGRNDVALDNTETQESGAKRRLAFEPSSRTSINVLETDFVHGHRGVGHQVTRYDRSSSDSDSEKDMEESDVSSLSSELRKSLKPSPTMRRLVDPSLAGFLSSPRTQKLTQKLQSKKYVKTKLKRSRPM